MTAPLDTLVGLVEAQAARTPDAVAVIHGEFEMSYAELLVDARRVSHELARLGAGREIAVGICVPRSLHLPVALVGCLQSGSACLPLDPAYPSERLGQILADAAPPIVVATEATVSRLPAYGGRLLMLESCATGDDPPEPAAPDRAAAGGDLAYLLYTSGSTGEPKGVMLTHGALAHHALAAASLYGLGPADRTLQFASIGFDVSIEEIFPTLATGGAVVLRDDDVPILGVPWLDWLTAARPTVLNLPTAHWHEWVRDLRALAREVPRFVRLVVVGGERALGAAYSVWQHVGGNRVRWINAYGPAEASVTVTAFEGPREGQWPEAVDPPIGRPIGRATVRVLDEQRRVVPRGGSGELFVGGPGLARGYVGRPDLTAERFVTSPDAPGERVYGTGDVVRELEDGNLVFLGRRDEQVKIRGVRIEPGEVESVLARHPAIAEVTVIARENVPGDRRLIAYVIPDRGRDASAGGVPSASDLRRFLAERVPRQLIPARFVLMEYLPLTASGKVDKAALPEADGSTHAADATWASFPTETEATVARAWRDVLAVQDIAPDEDFFDLGGQSLQATQIIAALRDELGIAIGVSALFDAPTVAGLAACIDAIRTPRLRSPPLVARFHEPGERIPLSGSQQHMWRMEAVAIPPGLYNITAMHTFCGPVDLDALREALRHVVGRHDTLRTQFRVKERRPYQVVVTDVSIDLDVCDLTGAAAEQRDGGFRRLLAEQDAAPFSIAHAPLLRARLYRLAPDHAVLATTLDHLICDGTSAYIFLAEVIAAYEACSAGNEPVLPALPVQYADFALWQREYLTDDVLAREIDHWKRTLAGMRLGPAVPFDHVPETPTRHIVARHVSVDSDLYTALQRLARQSGVTVFVVVATAFAALCSRVSDEKDVVLSTTLSGRQRAEVARLIGCFHSVGRLRVDLSSDPTFADLLERTRDAVSGLLDNSDVPFFRVRQTALPPMPSGGGAAFLASVPTEFQYFPTARDEWTPGAGVVERPGSNHGADELYFRGHMHPLVVTLLDDGARIWGTFSYKTDWYDTQRMDMLADGFVQILSAVAGEPSLRLSAIPTYAAAHRGS